MSQAHEEQELHVSFYNIYRGLHRAYGKHVPETGFDHEGKVAGRSSTIKDHYTPELWKLHLRGIQGLGVIPVTDAGTCFWGAIDIDVYPLDIIGLEEKIRGLKYPFAVTRSKSGGAHLTMFFSEPVPCKSVKEKLHAFAAKIGYPNAEVFPKQNSLKDEDDVGNWLNMPYFNVGNSTRRCIHEGKELHPEEFLRLVSRIRLTRHGFDLITISAGDAFNDGPPCLQTLVRNGGVEEGGRNNALFAMAIYCHKKFGKAGTSVDSVHNCNKAYFKTPLGEREVLTVIASAAKKGYGYNCEAYPLANHCNRDLCRDRRYGVGVTAKDLGFVIEKLEKIDATPVKWGVTLAGGRRFLIDTPSLISQGAFRAHVASQVNAIPKMLKTKDWERFLNEAMENAQLIESPEETRNDDRIIVILANFITHSPEVIDVNEMLSGRVYRDENNVVYFYAQDLINVLVQMGINISVGDTWGYLYAKGAVTEIFTIKGYKQKLWGIKTNVEGQRINTDDERPAF